MSGMVVPQALVIAADFLVLLAIILGFYVFFLNPRNLINRLVGIFILLFAITDLGISLALRGQNTQSLEIAYLIQVAFIPAVYPLVLITSLLLLKPEWFRGRRQLLAGLLMVVMASSLILTAVDQLFGTNLYYSGINSTLPHSGTLPVERLANGVLGWPVLMLNYYIIPVFTLIALATFGILDKGLPPFRRQLARVMIGVHFVVVVFHYILPLIFQPGISILVITSVYILLYSVLAFLQLVSERQFQTGQTQHRLTILSLIISVPTFIFLTINITNQTREALIEIASIRLEETNKALEDNLTKWLELNSNALQNLAAQPAMRSMEIDQQFPLLQQFQINFPYMGLVSTTDIFGLNVARSDNLAPIDYADRLWFIGAVRGRVGYNQIVIERTSNRPSLVVSTPIRNERNQIIGTVMFATDLETLASEITPRKLGATGLAYIVDERDTLVIHPELMGAQVGMDDYQHAPPVLALRRGVIGLANFTDAGGQRWQAYVSKLENNWGIVVQQQETDYLSTVSQAVQIAAVLIAGGALILFILTWATMRQAFRPFKALTETAQAIANGDLNREAPVEGDDEFGRLASSFNTMTTQLVELIDNLEQRVSQRTSELENRSIQLKAATEVGHAVATIRELDQLLAIITRLISESFGFYHVGIFLLDEDNEYAVLRAANSEGGRHMLERGHKLKVGQQGIVGYTTQRRQPRIALNVGLDSSHFNNPHLPETRSEMALPLIVGGQLLGVLDIQSTKENAFHQDDIDSLQVLADQVAIAISNARLLEQTHQLLDSERRAYRQINRQAWIDYLSETAQQGYIRTKDGVRPINSGATAPTASEVDHQSISLPVKVRGTTIGFIKARKPERAGQWTSEQISLLENLCTQLGIALDSARTYQETQMRAHNERTLAEISAHIRETLDVDYVLRTATGELMEALKLAEVEVRLGSPNGNGDGQEGV